LLGRRRRPGRLATFGALASVLHLPAAAADRSMPRSVQVDVVQGECHTSVAEAICKKCEDLNAAVVVVRGGAGASRTAADGGGGC
jgi:hypothetical protein